MALQDVQGVGYPKRGEVDKSEHKLAFLLDKLYFIEEAVERLGDSPHEIHEFMPGLASLICDCRKELRTIIA